MNTVTISLEDYENLKKKAQFPIHKASINKPKYGIGYVYDYYMSKEDFECELEREVKDLQNDIIELKNEKCKIEHEFEEYKKNNDPLCINELENSLEDYEDLKKRAEFPIKVFHKIGKTSTIQYMTKEQFDDYLDDENLKLKHKIKELEGQLSKKKRFWFW